MNGMNEDGHTGATSSKAPKKAGFAAVGVNNVRMKLAKYADEMTPGDEVFPGVKRADQFGQKRERLRESGECRFKGTFGTGGRSRNQTQFEAGFLLETKDR